MFKEKFAISVLLVSYNHENHIRQALDSLFGQTYDGSIELVIADDKSIDGTLSIIKEYEGKDSRFIFNYLNSEENLGITKNYKRGFAACSGELVAVLEGDDYWISPHKLTRQLEFLSAHWESDVCAVNYFVYEEERAYFQPRVAIADGHRFITARDLIADNIVGNFSTCMYRRLALARLPDAMFNIKSYDWITNIVLARTSVIGFIGEPMSVYRLHASGAWSQTPHIEKLKMQLELIPAYDALTDHVFHEDFNLLASRLRNAITVSKIGQIAEVASQPVTYAMPALLNYLPPLLIIAVKLLVPVAFKNFVVRILNRSCSK